MTYRGFPNWAPAFAGVQCCLLSPQAVLFAAELTPERVRGDGG